MPDRGIVAGGIALCLALVGPVEAQNRPRGRVRGQPGIATAAVFAGLVGHARSISRMAFSPDGAILASVDGKSLRLWDAATTQPRGTIKAAGSFESLAFSHDGTLLAVANSEGVRVFQIPTGREVARLLPSSVEAGLDFKASTLMFTPTRR